ncbi:uncharacterized protein V6R79_003808 [Siganus canaliculatus]
MEARVCQDVEGEENDPLLLQALHDERRESDEGFLRQRSNWPQSKTRHATSRLFGRTAAAGVFLIPNYNFMICKR